MPKIKMYTDRAKHPSSRPSEQGIATILLLLLVGMALTVMVLGTSAYLRQQQVYTLSNHAQTQAQLKAWTGAELVRQYLANAVAQGDWSALMQAVDVAKQEAANQGQNATEASTFSLTLAFTGEGVTDQINALITDINKVDNTITAQVTGKAAQGSSAEASAMLELVFRPENSSKPQVCVAITPATTVLHGDVKIGGGGSSFLSGKGYADLAIDGNLEVGGGGAAISGCTTGDISMTGGGIKPNATLYSENGSISVTSMSPSENASLWAGRNIIVGNSGNGTYKSLHAGAYKVDVIDASRVIIGSARAGGVLEKTSALPRTPPWRSGTLIPQSTGKIRVTLKDGTEYVLDMSKVTVNTVTGVITGADKGRAKLTAGEGGKELPDTFTLAANSVYGGLIDIYTLTVGKMWGDNLNIQGWGGNYQDVLAAGNVSLITGNIGNFQGGGDVNLTKCWPPYNCQYPTFAQGSQIAGNLYDANKLKIASSFGNVASGVSDLSPGLPGAPFCDTRSPSLDVASLKSQANYVFHFKDVNGKATPFLTIQNVNQNVSGSEPKSVAKQDINLKTVDLNEHTVADLQVRQIGGKGFISCGNQAYDNLWNDSLSCLRNASPSTGWDLTGITRFPPGVAWFEGALTINGVGNTRAGSNALHNTLLATGSIMLTSAGHGPLIAPNFVTPVSAMCGGDFYPSNLCKRDSAGNWALATWEDANGKTHEGLPIANLAIATDTSLSVSSWSDSNGVTGNVLVGTSVTTSGAGMSIYGTINVGMNVNPGTKNLVDLSQGSGLKVDSRGLKSDSAGGYLPSSSCQQVSSSGGSQSSGVRLLWSRFL